MNYVICKFWSEPTFSSGRRRRAFAAGRSRAQVRPPLAPVLATLPTVSVPAKPDLPKAA